MKVSGLVEPIELPKLARSYRTVIEAAKFDIEADWAVPLNRGVFAQHRYSRVPIVDFVMWLRTSPIGHRLFVDHVENATPTPKETADMGECARAGPAELSRFLIELLSGPTIVRPQ